jgi:hypothetical protein
MMIDILLWIALSFGVFLTGIALLPLVRENRKNYNAISYNFVKLMVALAVLQGGGFALKYVMGNIFGYYPPLGVDLISILGLLAILLQFTLYAFGLRRHYALPWVWYVFILSVLLLVGNPKINAPVLSSAAIAGSLIALFFYKASKNRSGLMFGIAMYICINLIASLLNQFIANNIYEEEICDLMGFIGGNLVIALATWKVYDRYLLYDRARENAIKSTWISKIMASANNSDSAPVIVTPVKVARYIRCPECGAKKKYEFSEDVVAARRKDPRGIAIVPVPEGIVCEHQILVFVNRDFDLLGYRTLELSA